MPHSRRAGGGSGAGAGGAACRAAPRVVSRFLVEQAVKVCPSCPCIGCIGRIGRLVQASTVQYCTTDLLKVCMKNEKYINKWVELNLFHNTTEKNATKHLRHQGEGVGVLCPGRDEDIQHPKLYEL